MTSRTNRRGFTLLELVLVCVVLGVLLTASLPRFQQSVERLRLERTAFELTQLLRYAHERSVGQGAELLWQWDDAARRARITAPPPAMEPVAESDRVPEGVTVTLVRDQRTVDCQCIRFFPDGTTESTLVRVDAHQRDYTLRVNGATSQILLAAGAPAR